MKRMIKKMVYPLRKMAGRFILDPNPLSSPRPIDLAANYICAQAVDGDYLEFGTFRGFSFIDAYNSISLAIEEWSSFKRCSLAFSKKDRAEAAFRKIVKKQVKFFAFDSFEGLPPVEGIDLGHPHFHKGRYDCTQDEFEDILKQAGVIMDKVVIVPGFYGDTLNEDTKMKHDLRNASIVMIDCDLYSSARIVLDFILDLIIDGTIIIFDDWFNYKANPNKGEQRACNEWLKENPKVKLVPYVRWGMTQMSFIVNKNGN